MQERFTIHHGDALDVLRGMPDNSVDAVVTDPPAGIAFMGKDWDKDKGGRGAWIGWMSQIAAECLRVLKPGAHALVWAIPRTSHWTATAWEDAGFEVRDRIAHVFGSGFPKSLDVSKAIDKMSGAERKIIGVSARHGGGNSQIMKGDYSSPITAPATEAAKQWDGWGTALKPAVEDWWLLRKPLSESSIAANVLRWGTGAVNVEGCRVEGGKRSPEFRQTLGIIEQSGSLSGAKTPRANLDATQGRFPANLIHDGSAEVVEMFPVTTQNGYRTNPSQPNVDDAVTFKLSRTRGERGHNDTGSAARFFKACPPDDAASLFYCAKASRSEREAGLDGMEARTIARSNEAKARIAAGESITDDEMRFGGFSATKAQNHHPTVKPQSLMRYLCRLITPPGGIILDPFFGSGSTGCAAIAEGFSIIGIEQDAEFVEIARRRCEHALGNVEDEMPLLAACGD